MVEKAAEEQSVAPVVLVTGSNGMVGHCIKELVKSITEGAADQAGGDAAAAASRIDSAWEVLRDRQDRESLEVVLRAVVPTVTFYFATRESDGSLSDQAKVESLFARVKPAYVIHLAAKVGGLFANMNDKVGFFEENLAMNSNIIRASHAHGIKKLVCVLSTCIYPDETAYPIQASSLH